MVSVYKRAVTHLDPTLDPTCGETSVLGTYSGKSVTIFL